MQRFFGVGFSSLFAEPKFSISFFWQQIFTQIRYNICRELSTYPTYVILSIRTNKRKRSEKLSSEHKNFKNEMIRPI